MRNLRCQFRSIQRHVLAFYLVLLLVAFLLPRAPLHWYSVVLEYPRRTAFPCRHQILGGYLPYSFKLVSTDVQLINPYRPEHLSMVCHGLWRLLSAGHTVHYNVADDTVGRPDNGEF